MSEEGDRLEYLRSIYNALSPQDKDGAFGKAIQYVLSCGGALLNAGSQIMSSLDFATVTNTMSRIQDAIQSSEKLTQEVIEANYGLNYAELKNKYKWTYDQSKYFAELEQLNASTDADLSKLADLKKKLISEIQLSQQEMAESIIQSSAVISSIIILVQVIKLWAVFKELHSASNVVKDSNLTVLTDQICELEQLTKKLTDLLGSKATSRKIELTCRKLSRAYCQTLPILNSVSARINGQIVKLEVYVDSSVLDGVTCLSLAVSSTFQAFILWNKLSNPYKIVAAVIPALFFGLGTSNFYASWLTFTRIEELKKELSAANSLTKRIEEIQKVLDDAETWLSQQDDSLTT